MSAVSYLACLSYASLSSINAQRKRRLFKVLYHPTDHNTHCCGQWFVFQISPVGFYLSLKQFESEKQVKTLMLQLSHTVTQHLCLLIISEINIETGVVDLVHHQGIGVFDVLGAGMAIRAKAVLF